MIDQNKIESTRSAAGPGGHASFQSRVRPWLMECFGPMIASDAEERNHRFLEESIELVQACGCSSSEAHQLVDYVYGRPVGEKAQEIGGVMVTLAALCLAQGLDMHATGEVELARIWTKVEKIRAKQAAKPKDSPLPEGKPAAPIATSTAAPKKGCTHLATIKWGAHDDTQAVGWCDVCKVNVTITRAEVEAWPDASTAEKGGA